MKNEELIELLLEELDESERQKNEASNLQKKISQIEQENMEGKD